MIVLSKRSKSIMRRGRGIVGEGKGGKRREKEEYGDQK
jgi:hypothetical protein